ncbi:mRNA decay activator protein ZFP36L1 [Bacillus rossius redtenbacheri]|uniref:mRNA decay activator protein ZFP36L1 n=1 Tax=Bacillus rossius redtenbacheri TaxID=93214 RepID=UPI002FDCA726
MSTAVMSPSSVYDFGDMLYKNHGSSGRSAAASHPKVLRWGADSSPRAVGSPLPHQTLSRRSSTPATVGSGGDMSIASLVSSVSSLLLDNIREQSELQAQSGGQHRKLDRSQSEPARGANINTSRYKTELCRPYEESGSCKYGDKCQFAHGMHELRNLVRHPKYKTELCRTFHTIGFCPYGPRCHFIHNAEEARGRGAASPPPARPQPLSICSSHFGGLLSGESTSPGSSSLSQSPTTSVGSFFSSDPDVVALLSAAGSPPPSAASVNNAFSFARDFASPLVQLGAGLSPPPSPAASLCSSRQSPTPQGLDSRLPVFNRLSSTMA